MIRSICCKSELVYITDGSKIKIDRKNIVALDELIKDKNVELKVQGKTFYHECGTCHKACDLTERPDFTPEQIDWICYQIGNWYLEWKHKIVNYEDKTHKLGHAKELLKIMICGDEK